MPNHVQTYLQNLRRSKGDRFVEELYQGLKAEHFERLPLPKIPGLTVQPRPEHDIRSRAPEYYQNEEPPRDDNGGGLIYWRPLRYGPR